MEIIDLRSDTVTKPTNAMRQFMMNADVGDDVYGEDPTVNLLQTKVAELFGKEKALFVPSGTMSNQLSLRILTEAGDEVITDADAHIYYYETAAPSVLSQIQIRPVKSLKGEPDIDEIESSIRPDIYYFPKTKVISIENTHNRHGGSIVSLDYIQSIKSLADKYGLKTHLDGARIWNAHVATGIPLNKYAENFDTISVCLSKGMGAPIGSLIVSNQENIKKALKWRKIFGGGMRQAGIIAAAGIYAIDNNLGLIAEDHKNAKSFAISISEINGISCDVTRVETNIVVFNLAKYINPDIFVNECKRRGLLLSSIGGTAIRVVFHLQINNQMTENSVNMIQDLINNIVKN
jgi:threonine aldolase